MTLIVDASVAIQWFVPERFSAFAHLLLRPRTLYAPDFILVELENVFWKKHRRGEIAPADIDEAMAEMTSGVVTLLPSRDLLPRARALAQALDHPVYDCLYLATAEAINGRVVTADRRFFDTAARSAHSERVLWIEDVGGPDGG
ncbi:type II toxin-antitoxin system VapC family toxin [Azospirillum sp. sgz302134]